MQRPILAAESTQAVLDYLLDFGCLVIVLTLGWTGVQEMGGFLATVTRVWFSWSCSRLLFRHAVHTQP